MFINVVRWILDLSVFLFICFYSIQISLHLLHATCLIIGTRLRQSQFRHRISFSQTCFPVDSISYFCNATRTTTRAIASTLNLYTTIQSTKLNFTLFYLNTQFLMRQEVRLLNEKFKVMIFLFFFFNFQAKVFSSTSHPTNLKITHNSVQISYLTNSMHNKLKKYELSLSQK